MPGNSTASHATTVFCPWASLTKAPRAKRLWPEVGDNWGPGLRCITVFEACGCFHPEDFGLIDINGIVLTCWVIHSSEKNTWRNMFKSSSMFVHQRTADKLGRNWISRGPTSGVLLFTTSSVWKKPFHWRYCCGFTWIIIHMFYHTFTAKLHLTHVNLR